MLSVRSFALLFSLVITACCNDESTCHFNDSTAQDRFLGGSVVSDPNASALFPAAQSAFRNNCVQCHSAFGAYTEAQWIAAGYVVAGQPSQSLIFQKTRGSATGGPENMPPGASMANSEILAVRSWITNLNTGGGSGGGTVTTPPASAGAQRLGAALAVFARPSAATGRSCNTCHAVQNTSSFYPGQPVPAFAVFTRDADFVTSQLVTVGAPASSWLYRALRGHGGDIASMPKTDSTSISAADAATLSDWITQIGN